MVGRLLKCTPGKSYECGKICLTVKKRCRLKPQGRQEEAEVATLGGLLGGTQPKALRQLRNSNRLMLLLKNSLKNRQSQNCQAVILVMNCWI
jgi:hypothetical protein